MATGIYSWSQTAASNNTADSTINWSEGQAPSTVNDSARAEMAAVAKWRDDMSGVRPSNTVMTTGGSANAQTLTTNGSIAALTNGWTLTFKSGFTNTGACTFAPDSLTAKNIQIVSGTNLTGGEIQAGCVYTVTYHQPADTWLMHSPGAIITGTWTPTLVTDGGVNFTSVTYDATTGGLYTKVGNLVHIQGTLATDSVTKGAAGGNVTIDGLPFTAVANTGSTLGGRSAIAVAEAYDWLGEVPIHAYVKANTTRIYLLYRNTVDGNGANTAVSDVATGANANNILFGGTYIAA